MATKPKTTARRKASVRVSKKKKRGISRVQALVVALVLAVVGVVVVVATRASGTPDYQYSWKSNCTFTQEHSDQRKVSPCMNKSAEAMVYRLYRGLYAKSPDDGGYKFWTQKLAGDRVKVTQTALVVEQSAKMGSDTAFVKALYTNMLNRPAKQKEVDQWVARLKAKGAKNWSRAKVAVQFASSSEAIKNNEDRWRTFADTAPTVTVVQTAAKEQRKRFDAMLLDYQQPAKSDMNVVSGDVSVAQKQLAAAASVAGKKVPTAGDLSTIGSYQRKAEEAYRHAKTRAALANTREAAAERMLDKAEEVASFSTDIGGSATYGISKIKARYNATKTYAATANSKANGIQSTIAKIADNYKVAQAKYEAEQLRLEKIRIQQRQDEMNADQLRAERARLDKLPLYSRPKTKSCLKGNFLMGEVMKDVSGGPVKGTPVAGCDRSNVISPDQLGHPICNPDYAPKRWIYNQQSQWYYCKRN